MEENSDSQMETDVSSTTQDVPPPQDRTGPTSSMEVTVEVAETSAEDEEMQEEEQDERIDSNTPEKAPPPLVVEPKIPLKIIVLKKSKTTATIADLERLKKDASQSPNKISLLKTHNFSSDSQVEYTIKNSLEKQPLLLDKIVIQKTPVKDPKTPVKDVTPVKDPKTPVKDVTPVKDPKTPVKDVTPVKDPKTPVKVITPVKDSKTPVKAVTPQKVPESELPIEKSPKKNVMAQSKPAEQVMTVEKTPTEKIETPSEAPETEANIPALEKLPTTNTPKKDKSDIPLVAEQPSAKVETPQKGEVTVTVSVEQHDEKEISDDSQNESIVSLASNKSISRELRSLINSAKESKIISECTQLKTKTRKSRTLLDSSNNSLNTSTDPEKIQNTRRESCNSQESSCSEKSEKVPLKKVLRLRSKTHDPVYKSKSTTPSKAQTEEHDSKAAKVEENPSKKKKTDALISVSTQNVSTIEDDPSKSLKLRSDPYCWRCHYAVELAPNEKAHEPACCTVCPRAFHYRCLTGPERLKKDKELSWVCPKCMIILHAESSETRSPVMKNITLGMLCDLLKYALQRMMEVNGVEPFTTPVDRTAFPEYDKCIVHAVDLGTIKRNIDEGVYGSTEAFVSDAQWIMHNSIIFNSPQSKLTAAAKALVRSCRTEMSEIEACPECYAAAHARRPTWFTDVCSNPHVLLWAKLKGFPYWPAKGMSVNSAGMVDARFFGAHDRAWVPARDCFLYCESDPNAFRSKRQDIIDSMQEAEQHIRNISRKFGKFIYPAFKVPFDPAKINEQLKMLIPGYEPPAPAQATTPSPVATGSSFSKSSKDSYGEMSDDEPPPSEKKRKAIEFVEVEVPSINMTMKSKTPTAAKKKESEKRERAKSVEIEVLDETPKQKQAPKVVSKKRRRSMWEALMTVMTPQPAKRQKTAGADTPDKSKPKPAENKVEAKAKETTETVKTYSKTGTSSPKPTPVEALKETKETPGTTSPRTTRASTPASTSKQTNKPTPKVNTPKEADKVKKAKAAQRQNSSSSDKEKEDKPKHKRDRTSKGNDSQNNTPKSANKKSNRSNSSSTNESDGNKNRTAAVIKPKGKSIKDIVVFDEENTSLAVLSKKNFMPRLPTISNVRSLSQTDLTDISKTTEMGGATSNSSIFTPTSTENVNNMKEAVAKLQKLRETEQPIVGRLGVRSFARMTSPPAQRDAADTDQVEVEVKAEPMDFEDADRQSEKIDFANTIRLRPVVNPQTIPSLRDIRITKVVTSTAPTTSNATGAMRKPVVVNRPTKARKTFPQPQKANELNSKNSMVYIPIQPPITQAPRPPVRVITSASGPGAPPQLRPQVAVGSTSTNNIVNTMTTPLMTVVTMSSGTTPMPTLTQVPSVGQMATLGTFGQGPLGTLSQGTLGALSQGTLGTLAQGTLGTLAQGTLGTLGQGPQVGQVPTTVHTVPLITSVNGQWTFSLQPMMSVGGVDRSASPPLSNGMPEPNAQLSPMMSIAPAAAAAAVPPLSSLGPKAIDSTPTELPRLQQKPHPLDPKAPAPEVPTPASAGPIHAKINQQAAKLADYFRTLLEESLEHMDHPPAVLTSLKREIERLQWRHKQQIEELKHNHDLQMAETRALFASEKVRAVNEARRTMQLDLTNAVKQAKSRQWCAFCQKEAQFYCCWNTSYCGYPCQRSHWAQHFAVCTQQRAQDSNRDSLDLTDDRLQPSDNPPALQKPTVGATVTVGGKVIQTRLVCQNSGPGNPSIIVRNTMAEDNSANSAMKCMNTYKGAPQATQSVPLLINKQMMNSEENTTKKMVTTGGYLIVGAANAASPSLNIN